MRRSIVVGGAVVVLALVVVGTMSLAAPPATEEVLPQQDTDPEYIEVNGTEASFWPYLSSEASDDYRIASPINVIVTADLKTTTRMLTEEGTFNETPEELGDAEPETFSAEEIQIEDGTVVSWGETAGATRYANVRVDGNDEWRVESMQLDHGDYYGVRHHLRLYEVSTDDDAIVLIQAHADHFDWFTLRHAVDGVEESQRYVEREFMHGPGDPFVWRQHLGNDETHDSDGWATVIELALIPLLGLSVAGVRRMQSTLTPVDRRRLRVAADRITWRHLALGGTIIGIVLGVRLAGLVLEWYASMLSMHAIAALLYPVLAIGLPVATYGIATGLLRRIDAAVVASGALSVAVLLDYTAMGVDVLPLTIVVHRAGVIVAIGLIAAGGARRATRERHLNELVVAGSVLWIGLLAVALFGFL